MNRHNLSNYEQFELYAFDVLPIHNNLVWQDEFNIIKSIVPIIEFREGLPDIDDFDKSLNN